MNNAKRTHLRLSKLDKTIESVWKVLDPMEIRVGKLRDRLQLLYNRREEIITSHNKRFAI